MRNDPTFASIEGLRRIHAILKWRGFHGVSAESLCGTPLSELEELAAELEQRFDEAAFGPDPYADSVVRNGLPLAEFLRSAAREHTAHAQLAKFYNAIARRRAEAWKDAANTDLALQAERNEA